MVRPEIVTVTPLLIEKTWPLALPFTVSWLAAGPLIVRFLAIVNRPDSVMVQGQPLRLKMIVSPAAASAIAWRKLPAPLSLVLVTVRVAALVRCRPFQRSAPPPTKRMTARSIRRIVWDSLICLLSVSEFLQLQSPGTGALLST